MVELAPRPRRSALYLPASNARALEKARGLASDVVILDLEDAVAPEIKVAARQAAVAAIAEGGFGARELVVRTNGLDTPWGADDLTAVAGAGPAAILVPKVDSPEDVARYDAAIAHAPAATRLWTMIETPLAVLSIAAIAAASEMTRLAAFVLGFNDLAKEMRAPLTPGRTPYLPVLAQTVLAARAHGLSVLDGVWNAIEDMQGFAEECAQGAAFGCDGKTLIHPNQIVPCNQAFAPTAEALASARAIVAAFADPDNAGKGAIRVEGKMAERLHLAEAERLLALQSAIEAAAQ